MKAEDVPALLAPYRERIDRLDRAIIDLLAQRYAVIREVGHLKAGKAVPAVIQTRVDEVRENAARMAAEAGLDEDFIRHLYAQLIAHSCALEDEIIEASVVIPVKASI
jgi:chorismate mutase-like protein